MKVDNDHVREYLGQSHTCKRHQLDGKRQLRLRCGGTGCPLFTHKNTRNLGGAGTEGAEGEQSGELLCDPAPSPLGELLLTLLRSPPPHPILSMAGLVGWELGDNLKPICLL